MVGILLLRSLDTTPARSDTRETLESTTKDSGTLAGPNVWMVGVSFGPRAEAANNFVDARLPEALGIAEQRAVVECVCSDEEEALIANAGSADSARATEMSTASPRALNFCMSPSDSGGFL